MALYPPAEKRLLAPGLNHSENGMGAIKGVILHVIVGSLSAADSVFHNPARKASAHFGVDFDGRVVQWVDTRDKAWAEGAGNPSWISVETAGYPDARLTQKQVEAVGAIVRWAHDLYHFPLQVTDSPSGTGVGTHQMGGGAWGGHSCPGQLRAAQRIDIVRIAQGSSPPTPQPQPQPQPPTTDEDPMYVITSDGYHAIYATNFIEKWWLPTVPVLNTAVFLSQAKRVDRVPRDFADAIPLIGTVPAGYTGAKA